MSGLNSPACDSSASAAPPPSPPSSPSSPSSSSSLAGFAPKLAAGAKEKVDEPWKGDAVEEDEEGASEDEPKSGFGGELMVGKARWWRW